MSASTASQRKAKMSVPVLSWVLIQMSKFVKMSLYKSASELKDEVKRQAGVPIFNWPLFNLIFLLQVALWGSLTYALVRVWSPAVIQANLYPSFWPLVSLFVIHHLATATFEWNFHKYVLHTHLLKRHKGLDRLLSFLRGAFIAHNMGHHGITPARVRQGVLFNDFPIDTDKKIQWATFPAHGITLAWLVISPVLLIEQMLMPQMPVLLTGYAAVGLAYWGYETFHWIDHLPDSWWQKVARQSWPNRLWLRPIWVPWLAICGWLLLMRRNHFTHHNKLKQCLNVFGFFGFPLIDWLMRTTAPKEKSELDSLWLASFGQHPVSSPQRRQAETNPATGGS